MKTIFITSLVLGSLAMAQEQVASPIHSSSEIESSCRVKAKEIAAETYRSCVTDQKNAQIEQIKKEYQKKLQDLKAHYENELKKMNSAKAKAALDEAENSTTAAPEEKDKSDKKIEDVINSAGTKAPAKKSAKSVANKTAGKAIVKSAAVPRKASKKTAGASPTEMTVKLKPAPITPPADESVMDLPEPIPVETMKTDSAI